MCPLANKLFPDQRNIESFSRHFETWARFANIQTGLEGSQRKWKTKEDTEKVEDRKEKYSSVLPFKKNCIIWGCVCVCWVGGSGFYPKPASLYHHKAVVNIKRKNGMTETRSELKTASPWWQMFHPYREDKHQRQLVAMVSSCRDWSWRTRYRLKIRCILGLKSMEQEGFSWPPPYPREGRGLETNESINRK